MVSGFEFIRFSFFLFLNRAGTSQDRTSPPPREKASVAASCGEKAEQTGPSQTRIGWKAPFCGPQKLRGAT